MLSLCILFSVIALCLTILGRQSLQNEHELAMKFNTLVQARLVKRVQALEASQGSKFDPAAFEDLKSKVEAMRIAQGLKR